MLLFLVKLYLLFGKNKVKNRPFDAIRGRAGSEKLAKTQPLYDKKIISKEVSFENFSAEWLFPPKASQEKILLYFHGGGYTGGSINTHRRLVSEIIKNAHISALMIEYRRAPESPFPAALEDAVESYKYLLAQGYKPENIAIGGDSAGGGLAVATLLFLKNNQIPLPKCAILLCPWVDLTFHFPSIERLDESDCIIDVKELKYRADLYIGKAEVRNPYISPYFGDLSGLPDMYVQTAEEDVLVDEGVAFAERAQKSGVKVEVETEKRAFHVYQAFWNFVPAGKKANQRLGAYLARKLC